MTDQVLGTNHQGPVYDEGEVASSTTVTPGMGIEKSSFASNGDPILQPVSTIEPADAQTRFAREQRLPPRSESGSVLEQAYQGGEHIEFYTVRRGDVVENALVASGTDLTNDGSVGGGTTAGSAQANVASGDSVAFYSDGSLKVAQSAAAAVGVAREAVDNSGAASGERARISIEVL